MNKFKSFIGRVGRNLSNVFKAKPPLAELIENGTGGLEKYRYKKRIIIVRRVGKIALNMKKNRGLRESAINYLDSISKESGDFFIVKSAIEELVKLLNCGEKDIELKAFAILSIKYIEITYNVIADYAENEIAKKIVKQSQ